MKFKSVCLLEAPLWSPLKIFCLHALETCGEKFSLRFIEVLWLKALDVEKNQVKMRRASFESPDMWRITIEHSCVFCNAPPLVNPLFRFHSLFRHVVSEMLSEMHVLWCVYTNPNTLLVNVSCCDKCDFFSSMYGSCLFISSYLRVRKCFMCEAVLDPLNIYLESYTLEHIMCQEALW